MKNHLKKYWFFIGLALIILCAFKFPQAGAKIKEWNLLKIAIFIAFLITGLTLETKTIISEIKNFKGLTTALLSTFVLFPVITFLLTKLFFRDNPDFVIGAYILAVAPVTVASGTVMTAVAKGNIPLSLFICVAANFLAIFTIPLSLNLLIQFEQQIDLPILAMIKSLALIVLLPIVIGQLLRPKLINLIKSCRKAFSIFSQLIVLLIIFNACAASTQRISWLGSAFFSALIFVIILHALILLLNLILAKSIALNLPSTAAFTIHTSQKTLTVSYVVWSTYFTAFPQAMLPIILYHLVQMIADTFVAHRFKTLADPPPPLPQNI